jgi:hypothetical protein
MYINHIKLKDFRAFRDAEIDFVHPDQDFEKLEMPKPRLSNVNLLLGNNGQGKTTLLKAIALAALGPAVRSSGIFPYRLVRREPETATKRVVPSKQKSVIRSKDTGKLSGYSKNTKNLIESPEDESDFPRAIIEADFTPHLQDHVPFPHIESRIKVTRRGDLEELDWAHPDDKSWHPIYSSSSDAFFFVGYGATRRVEKRTNVDLGSRSSNAFVRAQRVQSLFEESYSLLPLNTWLPQFAHENPGRYTQVLNLIGKLMGKGHYEFAGEMENGEYLFNRGGLKVPFPALSDGYRAFLGWIGDLLYHVCMTAPSGRVLRDNHGIVMVDEIDLHLHPKWQMTVLQTLATELPKVQFIVTSHSPLLVGSLEWMNIILMQPGRNQSSKTQRLERAVHGLDADQILLTDFFGMESTRAQGKNRRLKELSLQAREGDTEAAQKILAEMSRGMESLS